MQDYTGMALREAYARDRYNALCDDLGVKFVYADNPGIIMPSKTRYMKYTTFYICIRDIACIIVKGYANMRNAGNDRRNYRNTPEQNVLINTGGPVSDESIATCRNILNEVIKKYDEYLLVAKEIDEWNQGMMECMMTDADVERMENMRRMEIDANDIRTHRVTNLV